MNAMGAGQQPYYPPSSGWNKPKGPKGKALQNTDEIAYSKGASMETMPSLSKQLKGVTACVVGLKYVWEYRSPSMTVAPLYHCKLCNVHQFQGHMIAHISGWKHAIRYMVKEHPDKLTFTEEEIVKDPTLKKTLKEATAEVEKSVGRGQLKVILKEPSTVPAFKTLLASTQKQKSKVEQAGPPPPTRGGYRTGGFGGYASMHAPADYTSDQFYDSGHYQEINEYESYDYEQSGPSIDYRGPSNDYPEYRRGPMNTYEQPRRAEGGDLSNTLLSYLDTFKIENESDAQLVLKVTQKLTDILMEYRLSGAKDPVPGYSSQNFGRRPGYPLPPPKMSQLTERFSGYTAPPRYSGGPGRF